MAKITHLEALSAITAYVWESYMDNFSNIEIFFWPHEDKYYLEIEYTENLDIENGDYPFFKNDFIERDKEKQKKSYEECLKIHKKSILPHDGKKTFSYSNGLMSKCDNLGNPTLYYYEKCTAFEEMKFLTERKLKKLIKQVIA